LTSTCADQTSAGSWACVRTSWTTSQCARRSMTCS
jgi:hypothetical protein